VGKYSETLTDHVMDRRNAGVMDDPDLIGHAGAPGRGAFMILFLRVQDDRIAVAQYHSVGCVATIAAGSMLTELIVGRTIAECRELTTEHLIEALDGVPPDKLHCPALAIGALQDALSKWSTEAESGQEVTERSEGQGSGHEDGFVRGETHMDADGRRR